MLSAMALQEKETRLEQALEDNRQALCDLLNCLGAMGKKRVTLFIEKAGGDGKADSSGV